jgi:hypothetical protein
MGTATAKKRGKVKVTPPAKPAKKTRPRAKNGQGRQPGTQAALLLTVKAENPNITSEEFAIKFNLPVDEVARHRWFILQYTIDYNAKAAAQRMGYPEATANETGRLMLGYSFAQLYLSELQRAASVEAIVTHGQIMARAWEEANRPDTMKDGCVMTNSGTRLTALTLVARMAGLFAPKAPGDEKNKPRRVMYVGEGDLRDVTPEAWDKHARQSQKRLKAGTVIDG